MTRTSGTSSEQTSRRTGGDPAVTAHLQQYLSEELPPQLVPSVIVLLDALPLTPNRKVDIAALPDPPDAAYHLPREATVAPADEREETIAAIWREVLGRDDLSVHDNFFRLGGNSLAAMKVLARLARRHGARITVEDFFEQPTIQAMARQVKVGPDAG